MTGLQDEAHAALVDLAGRIMLTHDIDSDHAMRLLSIDRAEAEDMIHLGRLWSPVGVVRAERLRLFINILIRLEWRLNHDSRAIRHAMNLPLDALGGAAPADRFGGSLEDLRELRSAIDTVAAPTIKWWRVGH
ncbi:hypothetical protein SAMN05216557_101584 [Sphingomonas carotinifaciens]|uniref:DUF2384 domain-containing protein n=1 Tax=Sphingomonas carotinifaciens TaxID=1166323 RepID=A0A1G7FWF6_9SPHN|nr:hypothetical protein [Sphingomonas carotinifaciens]MWC42589.1 hypothetical protein [Sphingomonas carotinifaciens]SDE80218.1 hypothetical protein SAMN05216557_101584 [Sphingomonas carotinifaciens]